MKLRENLYQHEVYVPRVERLLEEHDPDDGAFFKEFEKVQETGADRTKAAMRETQALLDQTRRQLRALLATHAHNSLMTRNLFENREEVELVFEAPLDQLFSEIHGDQATGYAAAADSYLDSAFFVQAIACIDCALAQKSECTEAQPALISLRKYAAGMDHFSKGEYEASLDSLEGWLDAGADDIDQRPLRFADSALSRFDKLVNGKEDGELRARAVALLERIEKLLSVAPVI